jgi:hypothetical protein
MTSLPTDRLPRRRVRLLRWGLALFVAAVLTGLTGGYGVARLQQPSATDPARAGQAAPSVAASSPAAAAPTPPVDTACERAFDVYSAMHHAYLDGGVDFAETRRTAAQQLHALATLYPEPDRTYMIDLSEAIAAGSHISGEDRDARREAVDRESEAYVEFVRLAC